MIRIFFLAKGSGHLSQNSLMPSPQKIHRYLAFLYITVEGSERKSSSGHPIVLLSVRSLIMEEAIKWKSCKNNSLLRQLELFCH